MDLRKLEYFETVARFGNFTKAAEHLLVSQPSITTAIRSLEQSLGVTLLIRNQRQVQLTKEGEILYQKAVHILNDVNGAMQEMRDLRAVPNRIIRLGISPIMGSTLLPLLFSGFTTQRPDVIYHIQENGSYGLLEDLIKGSIEVAYIVFPENLTEEYQTKQILHGEVHALLHKDNPLCGLERIPFALLAEQPLVQLPTHSYLRRITDNLYAKQGITPNVVHEPDQMITTFELVAAGLGISFLLHNQMHMIRDNTSLVTRTIDEKLEYRAGFVWLKDGYISAVAQQLITYISENVS